MKLGKTIFLRDAKCSVCYANLDISAGKLDIIKDNGRLKCQGCMSKKHINQYKQCLETELNQDNYKDAEFFKLQQSQVDRVKSLEFEY